MMRPWSKSLEVEGDGEAKEGDRQEPTERDCEPEADGFGFGCLGSARVNQVVGWRETRLKRKSRRVRRRSFNGSLHNRTRSGSSELFLHVGMLSTE